MDNNFSKFTVLSLSVIALLTFSGFVIGQNKIVGEITVTPVPNSQAEAFATVNGERVISGRSIFSPAEIATPENSEAKITIADSGVIVLSPNSRMNLFFDESSISGNFFRGDVRIEIVAAKELRIQTPNGLLTKPAGNAYSVVVIGFAGGRTTVRTLTGKILFNGNEIAAGQDLPVTPQQVPGTSTAKKSNSGMFIILLVALAAGGALVGLTAAGGGNSGGGSTPVSPVR